MYKFSYYIKKNFFFFLRMRGLVRKQISHNPKDGVLCLYAKLLLYPFQFVWDFLSTPHIHKNKQKTMNSFPSLFFNIYFYELFSPLHPRFWLRPMNSSKLKFGVLNLIPLQILLANTRIVISFEIKVARASIKPLISSRRN